jgi:ribokinase
MKILVLGSLNLDYVYQIKHFVRPGETVSCNSRKTFCGGKGLNQAVAAAKAGAETLMAGLIGAEGAALKDALTENGVDARLVRQADVTGGHAVIQVTDDGQNSIIVYGGTNRLLTPELIFEAAEALEPGDIALMQNETNLTDKFARLCKKKQARVCLNPSPIDEWLLSKFPFELVDIFIVNETEGYALTGKIKAEDIAEEMRKRFPHAMSILTLGEDGSLYAGPEGYIRQQAISTKAVDTTAAGDTFTGYFLAELAAGNDITHCLSFASKAAAIAVSRSGAAGSIPKRQEVLML